MKVSRVMGSNPVCEASMQDCKEQIQEHQKQVQEQQEQTRKQGADSLVSVQDCADEELQPPPTVVHGKRQVVPIQEKALLTLEEAAAYTGLGMQKLRNISNYDSCRFVLWNGSKRMFKRKELEAYLANAYSI